MSVKVTAFQQRVYDAVCLIPRGKVTTYKSLAEFINCASAQAIGQALARNPFAPKVPCHRIIRTDGSLGGFIGTKDSSVVQLKIDRLAEEGIFFDDQGTLINKELSIDFSETLEN